MARRVEEMGVQEYQDHTLAINDQPGRRRTDDELLEDWKRRAGASTAKLYVGSQQARRAQIKSIRAQYNNGRLRDHGKRDSSGRRIGAPDVLSLPYDENGQPYAYDAEWLERSLDGRSPAAVGLPHCRAPRVASNQDLAAGASLIAPGESAVDAAVRLVQQLDASYLAIQGPPGSGKTYAGAQMIRALVRVGKRVGVTAVSHKVICNLLEEVRDQAARAGETVALARKGDEDDEPIDGIRIITDNAEALGAIADRSVQVLGGTAWLWAKPTAAAAVDVLFVDEAGQMSLANVLAVSQAGDSIVLLGDPQQLEQPQKGSHPDGVDVSALQHVIGGAQTMRPDLGIFLPETWRLAPTICGFTSEVFYDGKLQPRGDLESQRLTGVAPFEGAGLWLVPVGHEGNQNASPEEVQVVVDLVDRLLSHGSQWVDRQGIARPLTESDFRIVAPYNAQVSCLKSALASRGVPVGTVDKFQGQEAPVVIYSMASSSPGDAPRGMEFLYSLNRLNVATSRARCAAIVVASPTLFEPECRTLRQMQLANALCRFRELAKNARGVSPT